MYESQQKAYNKVHLEKEKELEGQGYKDSTNKIMTYELDSIFIQNMAKVMSMNKKDWGGKYDRLNHYKDINPIELIESIERHLLTLKEHWQNNKIEDLIDDDNCSHLTKIATNAQMLAIQLRKIQ